MLIETALRPGVDEVSARAPVRRQREFGSTLPRSSPLVMPIAGEVMGVGDASAVVALSLTQNLMEAGPRALGREPTVSRPACSCSTPQTPCADGSSPASLAPITPPMVTPICLTWRTGTGPTI